MLAGGIEDAFSEMTKIAENRRTGDRMTELWERDAWELADDVRAGKLKAVDLLDYFLARIDRFNEESERVLLPRRGTGPGRRGRGRCRGRAR